MKKVKGSSAAFAWGDLVVTKYNSGCLRSVFLASEGVREQIDEKHQVRGAMNEDRFQEGLEGEKVAFDRERAVSEPIMGFDDTYFVGRLDYLLHLPAGQTIAELKSSESYSVLKDVIKDGKYNSNNLAQLVAYMVAERCKNGLLIYTYYKTEKSSKVYKKAAERRFEIEISSDGKILIDGQPAPFTVQDQLHHRYLSAKCINEKKIWCRPYKFQDFDGPCKRCPFSKVCDWYDAGLIETTEDFVKQARETIETSKGS